MIESHVRTQLFVAGFDLFDNYLYAHLFLGCKSPHFKDKSGTGAVNAFKICYTSTRIQSHKGIFKFKTPDVLTDDVVQIHLFEYEMSRGLQVFSERNKL